MKYEKKNLLVVAAAGMLSLVMVSGCGPEKTTGKTGDTTTNNTNTTPKPDKKDDKPGTEGAYEFKQVTLAGDGNFKNLAVSDNNLYATANTGAKLYKVASAEVADGAKWATIAIDAAGLAGMDDSPGKAKLVGAKTVHDVVATQKGVLVEIGTTVARSESENNGVAYYDGTAFKAAWAPKVAGVLFNGVHVKYERTGLGESSKTVLNAGVVTKGGKDFPVIFKDSYKYAVSSDASLDAIPKKLDTWIGTSYLKVTRAFASRPFIAMAGKDALLVDQDAVRILRENDIGVAPGVLSATVTADTDAGAPSSDWKLDKKTDNKQVRAVLVTADNKLYIALHTTVDPADAKKENNTGGVIVYDLTTPTKLKLNAVSKEWSGVAVKALANIGNDVYAVSSTGLVKVGANGSKGAPLTATDLPNTGINDAKFVGDVLVVGTATGAFVGNLKK
jgi:hypothetical protein